MVVNNLVFAQDLAKPVQVRYLPGSLYEYDDGGLNLTVALYQDGEPVDVAGTISATVFRSDGTVPATISGTKSGNKATVAIPSAALMPGLVRIVVKSTESGIITTLLAITGTVVAIKGSAFIDTGSVIPDLNGYEEYVTEINGAMITIQDAFDIGKTLLEGDRYAITVSRT